MLVLGNAGDVEADADGRDEEPARLQPVQLGEVRGVAGDVAVLPPIMPRVATASRRGTSGSPT
jgi:hypothetical protein